MKKVLSAAKALRIRISEKGDLLAAVSKSSGEFVMGLELLRLLQLLPQRGGDNKRLAADLKKSFETLIKHLPDASEVASLVHDLHEVGVVVSNDAVATGGIQDGFGDAWTQWAMIADSERTKAYLAALEKHVNRDSVLLDVGAGTGVFSAFALLKGAKHVYAIEEAGIASVIPEILRKLGIRAEGRFTLLRANSADASFPRDVNLVVSELLGNDAFAEGMMATLADVASRIDKKKTKFIPGGVEIFAEAVDVKSGAAYKRISAISEKRTLDSKDFYERFLSVAKSSLNFSTLSFSSFFTKQDFCSVSAPVSLSRVKLGPPSEAGVLGGKALLKISQSARAPVVMLWFRLTLTEGITLSSRPGEKDHADHWSPVLVPLLEPLVERSTLSLEFGADAEVTQMEIVVRCNGKIIGRR